MESFKNFLLNEEKSFLGHRVGHVLTSIQDLQNDLGGMGIRQIARITEEIVNQLRKILHDQWGTQQLSYLKELQKIAVALMKAVEEKDDLKELIPKVSKELEKLSGKLGVKINNLEAPEAEAPGQAATQQDMELTGPGPTPQDQQQPQPAAQQGPPGQPPAQGGSQPPAPVQPPQAAFQPPPGV